ncbi:hypothetical protein ACFSCX_15235 [Bacillus salitolerans]|uniref:Uncharacterized protein n=1 Tax=Bacillus salitolerans TaxID=1437434 RepID=A0ABW4LT02_9BACI
MKDYEQLLEITEYILLLVLNNVIGNSSLVKNSKKENNNEIIEFLIKQKKVKMVVINGVIYFQYIEPTQSELRIFDLME